MTKLLELTLLGNPEIRLAGQSLARLRSAKAYALLYYLAVTRRTQPRTVLAGLFWGDVDEYYARRNLNRTLSDLTKVIGDHLVVERHTLVFARSQNYRLDVEMLEAASMQQPTPQNVAQLLAAAELYRGDFLEGFYVQDAPEFEQWVLTERTRARASALQLLQTLSQFHTEQGDLTLAMERARRILQLEPWREEAHRQLMLLLAQSGQRSAALAQYELCRQALRSELDVEPDAATLELVAQIRTGTFDQKPASQPEIRQASQSDRKSEPDEPPVAASPLHPASPSPAALIIPHNLPSQRLAFVGRAAEQADILRLLLDDADCRLLTLVGPGGMGKTRLALKVAEGIVALPAPQQVFGDGILFVPLENVGDGNGLVTAIISAISAQSSFPLQAEAPLPEQLFHFLRTKAMLLVLDNFEHLIQSATLLSDLLLAAPSVKLLVTSREMLGLVEAWFYPVVGLPMANPVAQPMVTGAESEAVQLFMQCARRMRPDFSLATERAAVLRICTLVEGMPLGIELAVAWLNVMTCEQIGQEVARGLDILTARYQNIPVRHRSMRVVMEHSWRLLSAGEADTMARLSIFRGKFSQEAARVITGASLFTLITLVDKALLRMMSDGYYQLHELTRQYAEEQVSTALKTALRNAHATYYAGLLHQQKSHLFTSAFRQIWATVGAELDNIRHAWLWLIAAADEGRDDLPLPSLLRQMAYVLTHYHLFHSLWLPVQALFDQARQVLDAAGWAQSSDMTDAQQSRRAAMLKLQICAGEIQVEMGHYRASLALAERLVVDCRAFGREDDLAYALLLYGRTQVRRGAYKEAIPVLEEALALGERLPALSCHGESLITLGVVSASEGRYSDAHTYYGRALALAQASGYRPWVERILTNMGTLYFRQQAYPAALDAYEQALQMAQEEGDQTFIMIITSNLGGVKRVSGQYQAALNLYQRSLAMARSLGMQRWIAANLNAIATAYLDMQDLVNAEGALREALVAGQQSDSNPDTLGSIGLMGHLFARRDQGEAALRVLLSVEQHPASFARDKVYNQPLLAQLRSALPPQRVEQAAAWAASQTIDDLVRWLLHGEAQHR